MYMLESELRQSKKRVLEIQLMTIHSHFHSHSYSHSCCCCCICHTTPYYCCRYYDYDDDARTQLLFALMQPRGQQTEYALAQGH